MSDDVSPLLLANLAALRGIDPTLVERITWPCASEHVAWGEGGLAQLRVHRSWHRLSLTEEEIAGAVQGASGRLLLFGLGLGELLGPLLSGGCTIEAWERDPWLLRQVLSRRDWSGPIKSGALRFRLTSDLLPLLEDLPPTVLRHPLLGQLYRLEERLLREGLRPRRALLALGGLFVDDLADALVEEGYSALPWDLVGWSREELAHVAQASVAEVVVAVNHTHGLPESCAELGIPLHIWEIDPATDGLRALPGGAEGPASRNTHIWTWRRAQRAAFARAGFAQVAHLPLAANARRRRRVAWGPQDEERYGGEVVFVGASMVETGLEYRRRLVGAYLLWKGGDPGAAVDTVEQALARVLDAQRDDLSVYRVPELLEAELPAFVRAAAENDGIFNMLDGASPAALLGEMAAADKRITYAANLGQVGIQVWGDEGWQHAEEYGAVWRGLAGHGDELTRIYSGPGIHVDIGRLYQEDIVTMRVFDVLACGGFCLASWSEDLEACFEIGVELDAYRTLEELLEKVELWMEAGPEARRDVGERGRQRVLRDHTIKARLRTMLGRRAPAQRPVGSTTL